MCCDWYSKNQLSEIESWCFLLSHLICCYGVYCGSESCEGSCFTLQYQLASRTHYAIYVGSYLLFNFFSFCDWLHFVSISEQVVMHHAWVFKVWALTKLSLLDRKSAEKLLANLSVYKSDNTKVERLTNDDRLSLFVLLLF